MNTEIVILGITFYSHNKMIKISYKESRLVGYLFQEKLLVLYSIDRNVKDMFVHSKLCVKYQVAKPVKRGQKDVSPVLMFLLICTKSQGQQVYTLQRLTRVLSAKI